MIKKLKYSTIDFTYDPEHLYFETTVEQLGVENTIEDDFTRETVIEIINPETGIGCNFEYAVDLDYEGEKIWWFKSINPEVFKGKILIKGETK